MRDLLEIWLPQSNVYHPSWLLIIHHLSVSVCVHLTVVLAKYSWTTWRIWSNLPEINPWTSIYNWLTSGVDTNQDVRHSQSTLASRKTATSHPVTQMLGKNLCGPWNCCVLLWITGNDRRKVWGKGQFWSVYRSRLQPAWTCRSLHGRRRFPDTQWRHVIKRCFKLVLVSSFELAHPPPVAAAVQFKQETSTTRLCM